MVWLFAFCAFSLLLFPLVRDNPNISDAGADLAFRLFLTIGIFALTMLLLLGLRVGYEAYIL